MALPTVTHTYRLAAEPEMKFSASGTAVIRIRLAANANRKNDAGQWEKTDELFINATAFGDQAQAIAEANLAVGQEVIVTGRLRTNSWENDQGEKRSAIELRLDSIGPKITPPRQQQGGGYGQQAGGYAANGSYGQPRQDQPAPQQGDDPWGQGGQQATTSEPPF